jgi:hypothetical protein
MVLARTDTVTPNDAERWVCNNERVVSFSSPAQTED